MIKKISEESTLITLCCFWSTSSQQWPGCRSAAPSPHADNTWVDVVHIVQKSLHWKEFWIDCQLRRTPRLNLNKRKTPISCMVLTYWIPSDAPSSMRPLLKSESNHIVVVVDYHLIFRDSDPDSWARVQLLMDHDEERRKELDYWKMFQVPFISWLLKRVTK